MTEGFFAATGNVLSDGKDLVCAVPHWDWEFWHFPQAETRAWAQRLAELGVRVCAGNHAYVVQPIVCIKDTLVVYGLGDFRGTALERQPWSMRIAAILIVEVSADAATRGGIVSYRLVLFIHLRDGDRKKVVLLNKVNGPIGTKARARWQTIYGTGTSTFTS